MQGGGLSEFIMKPDWQAKQIIRSHIWSALDDIGTGDRDRDFWQCLVIN